MKRSVVPLLLVITVVVGFHLASPEPVAAANVWSDCVPVLVGTFANRVHVKCAASVSGGIFWFAVDQSNAAFANRFMSVASTALVAGRTLTINYDTADKSGAAFGCNPDDCRKAFGINMR